MRWLLILLLAAPAFAKPAVLDNLGRCINQQNVEKNGVFGDCDARGNFFAHAVRPPPVVTPHFDDPLQERNFYHRGGHQGQ